jgi:hypothetical protein
MSDGEPAPDDGGYDAGMQPVPPSAPYPDSGGGSGVGGGSDPAGAAPVDEGEKKQWLRDKVATEIMTSEKAYVDSLTALLECFILPLSRPDAKILSADEMATLFSNLQVITQLNVKLLTDVEKRLKEWTSNPCLGDIFVNFAHFFKAMNHTNPTARQQSSTAKRVHALVADTVMCVRIMFCPLSSVCCVHRCTRSMWLTTTRPSPYWTSSRPTVRNSNRSAQRP